MKLFRGGFGVYEYYVVAKDETEAITKIKEQYNMQVYPVTVETIDNVDGYTIIAVKENEVLEENEEVKEEKKATRTKK